MPFKPTRCPSWPQRHHQVSFFWLETILGAFEEMPAPRPTENPSSLISIPSPPRDLRRKGAPTYARPAEQTNRCHSASRSPCLPEIPTSASRPHGECDASHSPA